MASPPAPGPDTRLGDDDVAKLDRLRAAYRRLQDELGRVIIGRRARSGTAASRESMPLSRNVRVARSWSIGQPLVVARASFMRRSQIRRASIPSAWAAKVVRTRWERTGAATAAISSSRTI